MLAALALSGCCTVTGYQTAPEVGGGYQFCLTCAPQATR